MRLEIGDELKVLGSKQKVTVIQDNGKVILLLLHGSGEPFVIISNYEVKNGY